MTVGSHNTKQKDNSRSWYDALWLRIQQEHQTQVHKLKQDKTEYSFIPQIISSLTSLNVYSCFYPSDPNPSHALPQTLPLHQPTTKQHVHQTNISKINIFCCYMKCAATLWIIFSTLTSYIVSDTKTIWFLPYVITISIILTRGQLNGTLQLPSSSASEASSSGEVSLIGSLAAGKTVSDVWAMVNKSEFSPNAYVMQGGIPHQQCSSPMGANSHDLLHTHHHDTHHAPLHGLCVWRLLSYLRSRSHSYIHSHHLPLLLHFHPLLLHCHCLQHWTLTLNPPP